MRLRAILKANLKLELKMRMVWNTYEKGIGEIKYVNDNHITHNNVRGYELKARFKTRQSKFKTRVKNKGCLKY